ncbi:hypothetical protein HNP24_001281 [Chryseobacterium sediminis]|uniref:Uncharacterized protein n=1 Tax=Chryseobacterium sediminis TaxID=1679494 RepID=A0ABR6PXZ6_9FLAO|nr:hypothetical protein [Chryseobacterium sediminis]MBB6330331.1 hypothetical protein [Chryseobacterium sediminis]
MVFLCFICDVYQCIDHLANARVSFTKNNGGVAEVTDVNNYYSSGLNHISGLSTLAAAEFYYGGIGHGQSIIDRVKTDYTRLTYEWNKIYNIQNKIK